MGNPALWLLPEAPFAPPEPATTPIGCVLEEYSYRKTHKRRKQKNGKKKREPTTEAPSPNTALRAKSGTGSHDGRPMTFPK